jgi:hypothetical protein
MKYTVAQIVSPGMTVCPCNALACIFLPRPYLRLKTPEEEIDRHQSHIISGIKKGGQPVCHRIGKLRSIFADNCLAQGRSSMDLNALLAATLEDFGSGWPYPSFAFFLFLILILLVMIMD